MSFRDTQVGKLPEEWNVEIIDNLKSSERNAIAMGPFGSKIKKDSFVDSGVPIIRGNNLRPFKFFDDDFVYIKEEKAQELKSSWVKRRDIVITHRGTLGQVGFVPDKSRFSRYIVSQSGMKLTCNESKINSRFLYYYLNSPKGQYYLLMNTSQVGVPAIAQASTSLKKIPVPIPLMSEQNKIAHILSTLDEKIEVNNQINKTLESMAQAIFKHWFVDFEFPNENGEPYKSSGGEMVESELGMIPKGWQVGELSKLVKIIDNRGKTPPQKNSKTIYPVLDVKALSGDNRIIDYQNCMKFVSKETYETWFRSGHPKEGDILLSTVGSLAEMKIFYGSIGCIAQNVVALRCSTISNLYIYQYLKHIKNDLVSYNIGSVQPSIKITHVIKHRVLKPAEEMEDKFDRITQDITNLIYNICLESKKLKDLRDTLLPKLMSGEIRVPVGQ